MTPEEIAKAIKENGGVWVVLPTIPKEGIILIYGVA